MCSRTALRIVLPMGGLVTLAVLCALSGAPSRACERARYWFVWGGVDFPPAAEVARIQVPLPSGTGPIEVSGVLSYTNGTRGCRRGKDLPLRRVEVEAGGVSLRIEDASRSSIEGSRELAAERGKLLVASIRGIFDAGDMAPIDYRYYHFRPGEPVELELPFSIMVTPPASETGGGRFSVKLGDLEVADRRARNDLDRVWEPYFRGDRRVRVDVAMVHWRGDTRYASVSLNEVDANGCRDVEAVEKELWHLSLDGKQVLCEAVTTGAAADDRES